MTNNLHCCLRCAGSFKTAISTPQLCGRCISQTPAFNKTHAPYLYHGIMRYLIIHLKFNQQYKNARLLGYLLANYLQKMVELPETIIPVPLYSQRFRERGFNQSTEIAKSLSKQLKIPINTHACIRTRNTPHQIDLPAKQRITNIKNAFTINSPINARHVAVVDDVMTTGSTVNELAKVLKKSGINRIDIWVCARASI